MAFRKLKFSKSWNNANDFPTVEMDEARVRADMQLLHDEAKNAINDLIDALNNEGLANTIRVDDASQQPVRYIRILDDRSLQVSSDGVKWTSVLGPESAIYETHAERHKEGGSDPLTPEDIGAYAKEEILSEATAAKYGKDSGATPDDILSALGEYKLHRWERTTRSWAGSVPSYSQLRLMREAEESDSVTLLYAEDYAIDAYGNLDLVEPTHLKAYVDNIEAYQGELAGKYCIFLNGDVSQSSVYHISEDSDIFTDEVVVDRHEIRDENGDVIKVEFTYAYNVFFDQACKVQVDTEQEVTCVSSGDAEAYPQSGSVVEGEGTQNVLRYDYRYLGVPLERAADAVQTDEMAKDLSALRTELKNYTNDKVADAGVKTAIGTYTGNGNYGEGDPCILTFEFVPELVILIRDDQYAKTAPDQLILMRGQTAYCSMTTNNSNANGISWSGKSVSWWSERGSAVQYNIADVGYRYFALGR